MILINKLHNKIFRKANLAPAPTANLGKNQDRLNFLLIDQFAEIGGIHTQVVGDVFVRHQLKDMRAPLPHFVELLFRRIALQFRRKPTANPSKWL
ncbi:MAG TPA: hypothetical protein VHC48_12815 [Puia sp.]|nr:hypothetical protein [Puia sp.]